MLAFLTLFALARLIAMLSLGKLIRLTLHLIGGLLRGLLASLPTRIFADLIGRLRQRVLRQFASLLGGLAKLLSLLRFTHPLLMPCSTINILCGLVNLLA